MFKRKNKILKLLHKLSIIKSMNCTQNTFDFSQDDIDIVEVLAVLKSEDIVLTHNNTIKLAESVKDIVLYEYNRKTFNILNSLYKNAIILHIDIRYTEAITLDTTSYESVVDTYAVLKAYGYEVKNDKELIELAKTKIIPRKKLIIHTASLGKAAFEGSHVKQYRLPVMHCYDVNLIEDIHKLNTPPIK